MLWTSAREDWGVEGPGNPCGGTIPQCDCPGVCVVKGVSAASVLKRAPCVEEAPRVKETAWVSETVCVNEARCVRGTACVRSRYEREMGLVCGRTQPHLRVEVSWNGV